MKKTIALFALMMLVLTGCGQPLPTGFSQDFYNSSINAFAEIDDDIAELDVSDVDDIANVELLASKADTPQEQKAVELARQAIEHNAIIASSEKKNLGQAIGEYLKVRKAFHKLLELPEYEFQFKEK